MAFRQIALQLVAVVVVATSIGCAHQVKIASNVPGAQVRVDGERLGAVKDDAIFTERGGIGASYDIEVVASGYVTKRQIVKPSEIDAWVGIPTVGLAAGSCCLAGCGAPLLALLASSTNEVDVQVVGYSIAGGLVGVAVGSAAIAAWGVERLPDVVTFDLVAVGEELVAAPSGGVPTAGTPKDEDDAEVQAPPAPPQTQPTPSTPTIPSTPEPPATPPRTPRPVPQPKSTAAPGGNMGF